MGSMHLRLCHVGLEELIEGHDGLVSDVEVRGHAPKLCHIQLPAALVKSSHPAPAGHTCMLSNSAESTFLKQLASYPQLGIFLSDSLRLQPRKNLDTQHAPFTLILQPLSKC